MTAIYKRELKSYFSSVIAFLFIAATLFLVGLYFVSYNIFSGVPNISYALSSTVILFLISIPILTMRVLAEERKQKIDQLILTAPVSVGNVVIGKFLALLTIYAIPVVIIATFPLLLSAYGTVPFAESYLALLGFFLYGAACIAVGLFVSSLTESQVIASVLSFVLLFIGFVMSGICSLISSSGNMLTQILGTFDMVGRFEALMGGTLDVKAIVYFISLIGFMLFFTTQSIQKRRYSVSVKNFQFGAYSSGMIAVALCIVLAVNVLIAQIPAKYTSIDVTSNKLFSITEQTENFLDTLNQDVTIYVLNAKDNADATVSATLERYTETSKHVKVEYIDPNVNPKFHTQYTSDPAVSLNSLIVVSDKRSKLINYNEMYEQEIDYTTYSSNTTGYDGEGQITSAIAYVTGDDMPKIYFIEGHGELELEAGFIQSIEKENMEYESINLLQYDTVPEDADAIFINAPTSDLSADDTTKIMTYLQNGGRLFAASTWSEQELPNFEKILAFYNVALEDGLVVENDKDYYYQNQMYLLPEVAYDDVTGEIAGNSYVFAPYVQGISYTDTEEDDVAATPLLTTSDTSFSRVDLQNETSLEKGENDKQGPFTAGIRVTKTIGEKESEMILFSSANIFTQSANLMVSGSNMKLFSGMIGTIGEREVSVSIPVKSYDMSYLTIPASQMMWISLGIVVILPIGLMIAGFIIWFKRRKK